MLQDQNAMVQGTKDLDRFGPPVVVCIALGVYDCLEGVPARPYIFGGTGLHGKS